MRPLSCPFLSSPFYLKLDKWYFLEFLDTSLGMCLFYTHMDLTEDGMSDRECVFCFPQRDLARRGAAPLICLGSPLVRIEATMQELEMSTP